ncbi:MAG: VWA domain-containing protein [Gammaproteobacteria bacterium]|jgi:Ca-activated chloride channel family protein
MWVLAWWWMLLVLPVPWLLRHSVGREKLDRGAALDVPSASPLAALVEAGSGGGRGNWSAAVLWAVWALAVLASARPQHVGEPLALPISGRDLLLAVDLSGSMEEQDFVLFGSPVDRLTATKAVAEQFIDERVGDRVGLILFGRQAYLQAPLTFDRETVRTFLLESAIGLAGKETAIGDAIGLAIRTLEDAGVEDGRRVLILLTDGANTAGEVDPLKAASLAAERSMVIYTIGVGADSMTVRTLFGERQINPSADLDETTLARIAELTGGQYFRARDTEELAEIYAILDELEPAESDEAGFRPVTELFYWPLAAAVILALVAGAAQIAPVRRLAGGNRHG